MADHSSEYIITIFGYSLRKTGKAFKNMESKNDKITKYSEFRHLNYDGWSHIIEYEATDASFVKLFRI